MENKNKEHIEVAVNLWNAAYEAVESKKVLTFLDRLVKFHAHLDRAGLLNDEIAKQEIQARAKQFTNETFLYRILSVASTLSRESPDGSDIMTQVSTLKLLNNLFLDYAIQKKFSPDPSVSTLEWDRKIGACIFLHCLKEKVKKKITDQFRNPELQEELLTELSNIKNCDTALEFYIKRLKLNLDPNFLADIKKLAHKAFIIEYVDYKGAQKLVECKECLDAIGSDHEPSLRKMRTLVEKNFLGKFTKMSEEEKIVIVMIIINNNVVDPIGHESPIKPTGIVQKVVYELLRSTNFKITPKIQELPQHALKIIHESLDTKLQHMPLTRGSSVIGIAISHMSGEAKQRKSLTKAKSDLGSMIKKENENTEKKHL